MGKNKLENSLFDDLETEWQKEWKDMPEFVQEDLTSHRKIVIHFRNDEDVKKFAELLGQKITPKQPSLWFPEMPPRRYAHLRYVSNEE
jgi:hypothetical protein